MPNVDNLPSQSRATSLRRLVGWLAWIVPAVAAVLVGVFILVVVRPFDQTPDPRETDIAAAWNGSIARLGILPVFPPEEDLHVGDLWAVIAADPEEMPLLGKAVRLTHIDMRDLLQTGRHSQPLFADTVIQGQGDPFRKQPRGEVADPGEDIRLSLTAFPGITIRHVRRAQGSFLARTFGGMTGMREGSTLDEIRIPVAETYGVDAAAAIGRLEDWCRDPQSTRFCTDAFVRRIIAFTVSSRVMAVQDGQYSVRLQLRLVTRVFLTREIVHSRTGETSTGAATRLALDRAGNGESRAEAASQARSAPEDRSSASATERGGAVLDARSAAISVALGATSSGASAELIRAEGTEIALRQVFLRPVAIGYRAITVALVPQQPPKGE